jgi:hypothetical protein
MNETYTKATAVIGITRTANTAISFLMPFFVHKDSRIGTSATVWRSVAVKHRHRKDGWRWRRGTPITTMLTNPGYRCFSKRLYMPVDCNPSYAYKLNVCNTIPVTSRLCCRTIARFHTRFLCGTVSGRSTKLKIRGQDAIWLP